MPTTARYTSRVFHRTIDDLPDITTPSHGTPTTTRSRWISAPLALATALLCTGGTDAQQQSPVPFTLGNQGTAGPATPTAPLLASNRSFADTAWCKQFTCTLRSKAASNDGYRLPAGQRLIAYTYATRIGTVTVWRLASTGQVLRTRLRPTTWNHPQLSSLLRLVTGENIPASVTARCATQTASWKNLWSRAMTTMTTSTGSFVPVSVNCEVDHGAALSIVVPLTSAQATVTRRQGRPVPTTATPRVAPSTSTRQRTFLRNWIGCRDAGRLDDLQLLAVQNHDQASRFMDQMIDVGQCRLFRVGNRYAVVHAPVNGDYWRITALDTGVTYWTIPEGLTSP